jgi:S-adenosylmethionine decarboxylase
MLTSLDIHDCNPKTIRDAKAVERFAHLLCDRIGMKRFGPTTVVDFGEDPRVSGFSMTQLIETSLVSGHFANQTNAVYLDVFSCKFYDAQAVIDEAVMFFGGKSFNVHCVLRGCENFPEDYRKEFPDRNILLNSVPAVA